MTNGTDESNFVKTDNVPDNLSVLTSVYEQSIFDCSNNISFSLFNRISVFMIYIHASPDSVGRGGGA